MDLSSLAFSRIGTEHEKLVVTAGDKTRADYTKIEALLKSLISRFGWEPLTEEGNVIGAKIDGQSVTLEPGGQLELSGAPVQNLHLTCAEVNSHLYQVSSPIQNKFFVPKQSCSTYYRNLQVYAWSSCVVVLYEQLCA